MVTQYYCVIQQHEYGPVLKHNNRYVPVLMSSFLFTPGDASLRGSAGPDQEAGGATPAPGARVEADHPPGAVHGSRRHGAGDGQVEEDRRRQEPRDREVPGGAGHDPAGVTGAAAARGGPPRHHGRVQWEQQSWGQ